MKKDYYIITGTSRGIGEALASLLLGPEHSLICISRTRNPRLEVESITKNGFLRDIEFDLADTGKLSEVMHGILGEIDEDEVKSITLVNNAGIVAPVKQIGNVDRPALITRNFKVNLLAPALITERFIHETEDWNVPRRIVNISSGAARRPVIGWSSYCSAKAGLEMYSQCLAKEQEEKPNPIKIISFSPGVVDTEMQTEIREVSQADFPERERFIELKESGELKDPKGVALELLNLMQTPEKAGGIFVRWPDSKQTL